MALRSVDRSLLGAVKLTVAALAVPDEDLALVRAAEVVAVTIDEMPPGTRTAMLPQHVGQLVRCLNELEARAVKRRAPVPAPAAAGAAPVNPLTELRRVHSQRVAKRGAS